MITTLIGRELLNNLMTFRFAAVLLITLLLVVANTFVLIQDYGQRLESYNASVKTHYREIQEKQTYSAGEVEVDRPPNPLSIFNVGLDKRLGNEIWIAHNNVPTLWEARMNASDNPYLNILSSIDIVFVFEVVLSLMALLFAYDALAGEREHGTLRLVLTHSIRRGHILLAKYISAMLCLLVPLLLSLLLAMVLLTTTVSISLGADDFGRIGGIVLTSIAYLSVFYLIGLLISAVTQRTGTALMLAMFVWGVLVLVYPNLILAAVRSSAIPEAKAVSAFNQIKQVWDEFDRDRKHFLATDAFPGEDPTFNINGMGFFYEHFPEEPRTLLYLYNSMMTFGELDEKFEREIPHAQNYFQFLIPSTIKTAERAWLIRKQALEDTLVRKANMKRALLKFSPVGMYDAATQAWAGTDLKGVRDFFDAVRQYRLTVIDYLDSKNAFASQKWFTADAGAADWRTLPAFSFKRSGVEVNAKRALPDMFLLLTMNLLLFTIIFLVFIKSEV